MAFDLLVRDTAITVIGNCHAWPLAMTIGLVGQSVSVQHIGLDAHGHSPFREALERLHSASEDDDGLLVFSMCASDAFGLAETAALRRALGDRLRTFTNIRFDGLHPDMTYFGGYRQRYPSAFGQYHSKLALYGYVSGRSVDETIGLFRGANYEALGYFGIFDESAAELVRRDEECDIRFARPFLDMVKEEPALHTFNHPTPGVFARLAAHLLDAADVPRHACDASLMASNLSAEAAWPVFDEIAEHHGLQYRTPQVIFTARNDAAMTSRGVGMRDAVAVMFNGYDALDRQVMAEDLAAQPYFERFATVLD